MEVARIARLARNRRFLARVFTADEVKYCRGKKNAAQHFAVRFAAKEAVWKALNEHTRVRGISHREISVGRAASGQPVVELSKRLKEFEPRISLSLSHTKDFALAVALLSN